MEGSRRRAARSSSLWGTVAVRWALPIGVAVAAIAVSAPGALSHAMWGDEVASARVVSESNLGGVLERVRTTESTPPAWYVLAWTVSKADDAVTNGALFSPVERLRLLSVLFVALASVLTMLWALRLLCDRLLAALAGVLVALGSVPAIYAEHLRAYALVMLMSVTFGLFLVRVAARPEIWSWCALALCVWIGALTHYFFFLMVGAGAVWLWASRPRPPWGGKATIALGFGVLGFLPWLPGFLDQQGHGRYRWIGGFDAVSVADIPGSLFFGPSGLLFGLARLALTVALIVGAVVLWRRQGGTAIVALALLPIAGAALVWALGQPVFNQRNMLPVVPFLAILVAAAPLALPRRLVNPVAVVVIAAAIAGAAFAQITLGRIEYDHVADALVQEGWTVDDPILVDLPRAKTSARIAVAWYLPGHPTFARAPRVEHKCSRLFVVGHSSVLGPWLARHSGDVEAVRELTSFDHPSRGRENGRIVIARLRSFTDLPGELFYVRARTIPCLRAS